MLDLQLPARHEWITQEPTYGKLAIEPFESGFAATPLVFGPEDTHSPNKGAQMLTIRDGKWVIAEGQNNGDYTTVPDLPAPQRVRGKQVTRTNLAWYSPALVPRPTLHQGGARWLPPPGGGGRGSVPRR